MVTVTDMTIAHTQPLESDGSEGRASGVQGGGSLTANRVVVSRSDDGGIVVAHVGTEVVLTDVVLASGSRAERRPLAL